MTSRDQLSQANDLHRLTVKHMINDVRDRAKHVTVAGLAAIAMALITVGNTIRALSDISVITTVSIAFLCAAAIAFSSEGIWWALSKADDEANLATLEAHGMASAVGEPVDSGRATQLASDATRHMLSAILALASAGAAAIVSAV